MASRRHHRRATIRNGKVVRKAGYLYYVKGGHVYEAKMKHSGAKRRRASTKKKGKRRGTKRRVSAKKKKSGSKKRKGYTPTSKLHGAALKARKKKQAKRGRAGKRKGAKRSTKRRATKRGGKSKRRGRSTPTSKLHGAALKARLKKQGASRPQIRAALAEDRASYAHEDYEEQAGALSRYGF